jgi:ribosome-associated protein
MQHEFDESFQEGPSRSQRRREALDVLVLAEKLVAMTPSQLAKVPLSESILDAVKEAQRISSHIAHKRQVHFLAKQMRKIDDLEPIRAAVDQPLETRRKETAELHLIEDWRERLIQEGDEGLTEFLRCYPDADRSHLRQLIRQSQVERKSNRSPSAQRQLFQDIKLAIRKPIDGDADVDNG